MFKLMYRMTYIIASALSALAQFLVICLCCSLHYKQILEDVPQGEIVVGFELISTVQISKGTPKVTQFSLHITSHSVHINLK